MHNTLWTTSLCLMLALGACAKPPTLPGAGSSSSNLEPGERPKPGVEQPIGSPGGVPDADIVKTEEALSLKEVSDSTALPMLSNSQLENALRDVFMIDEGVAVVKNDLPRPNTSTTFDNDSSMMLMSDGLFEAYTALIDNLTATVVDGKLYTKAIPANAPAADGQARARAIVEPILTRAYRRAPTAAEVTAVTTLFVNAKATLKASSGDAAGFRALIPAVILSPKFVYKSEFGAEAENGYVKLSASEVAARLASALWDGIPDEQLLKVAADGSLLNEATLESEVDRMLKSPKAEKTLVEFNMHLFEAEEFINVARRDESVWTAKGKQNLVAEAKAFFNEVVNAEKKGLSQILTAKYAFATDTSAEFYGAGAGSAQPTKIEVDSKERSGFYTQVGFLALRANDDDSLIIRRGAQIGRNLVCNHSTEAEPAVPAPIDFSKFKTAREAVAAGTNACGGACHAPLMNPIGFAFENYDNKGVYRTQAKGEPINAADVFSFSKGRDVKYKNAVEFVEGLATKFETHRCYVSKLLQFTYGRRENLGDTILINQLANLSLTGTGTTELFKTAVMSPQFLERPAQK